jgi:hypothetical protein
MSEYPSWICSPCGHKYGRPRAILATFHEVDRCGWCGEKTATTEPRDFGYPEPRP